MPKYLKHMHSDGSYSKKKTSQNDHSLSLVVIRCNVVTRCHSLPLNVSLVCLFINNLDIVGNIGKAIQIV